MTDRFKIFHHIKYQVSREQMHFNVSYPSQSEPQHSDNSMKKHLKIAIIGLIMLLMCPCVFAETHFGISVDTGDQKVSWVGSEQSGLDQQNIGRLNLKVSEDHYVKKADRWNPSYDTDIDYGELIKSFKLYLVIKKAF